MKRTLCLLTTLLTASMAQAAFVLDVSVSSAMATTA